MNDGLKVIHFNTQGFQNKVDNINNFVKVHKPDILVVTEHFQKNSSDLEQIDGYRLVNSFCREHNERGGVAIWARPDIPCRPRRDLDRHRREKEFELVSVSVGEDLVVTGAYRPPSTSIPEFHVHLGRLIKKINKEPHIKHVLTGDFNVDNSKPNKTRDVLADNDLMFHITSRTHRHGRSIDNFITNFRASTSRVIKSKSSAFSDHHPIQLLVHKEVTMIAKKPDSFLVKLFRTIFPKSDSPSVDKTSNKYFTPPRKSPSVFYNVFKSMFNKKTSTSESQEQIKPSTFNRESSKKTKKRIPRSKNPKEVKKTSFFSRILTKITPEWLKFLKPKPVSSSSKTPKKSYKNKTSNSQKEVVVKSGSFFSTIIDIFSSLFKK